MWYLPHKLSCLSQYSAKGHSKLEIVKKIICLGRAYDLLFYRGVNSRVSNPRGIQGCQFGPTMGAITVSHILVGPQEGKRVASWLEVVSALAFEAEAGNRATLSKVALVSTSTFEAKAGIMSHLTQFPPLS